MKTKVLMAVLALGSLASAGVFRVSAKVVESSAKLGYTVAKASAKVASYPVRYPVKSAKKSAHVAAKVAY